MEIGKRFTYLKRCSINYLIYHNALYNDNDNGNDNDNKKLLSIFAIVI